MSETASIWLALRHIPYEGPEIIGAFSSEANAESFISFLKDGYDVSAEEWKLDIGEDREYENVDGWHTPVDLVWTPEGVTRKYGKAAVRSRQPAKE